MSSKKHFNIIIIGAGLSGIAAGYRLLKAGFTDFAILEKASGIGGTWRDNTYPGCECDVPSKLYSYSFHQNPDWSQTFAGQEEILSYIKDTAQNYNIMPHIKLNTAIDSLHWNSDATRWEAHTSQGDFSAQFAISCTGYLHLPKIPKFEGIDTFQGIAFHSSNWRHDIDFKGKNVAVIGTGASAIQFVPKLQKEVKQLYLFQRSAPWVLPKPNRKTYDLERRFFALPFSLNSWRKAMFSGLEILGTAFRKPVLLKPIEAFARAYLKRAIPDKTLREKVTPNFRLGCKRMLLSNAYYPALTQDNVDVITGGISKLDKNTVISQNGESRSGIDIIIYGTGFYVTDSPMSTMITGKYDSTLAQTWQGSPSAYLGTVIHGFPNFFMVLGPNIGFGHSSATEVIEAQLDYVIKALKATQKNGIKVLDIQQSKQQNYNDKVQKGLQNTVWNAGGCSSYYLDKNGQNSVIFPWSNLTLKRWLNNFQLDEFEIQH